MTTVKTQNAARKCHLVLTLCTVVHSGYNLCLLFPGFLLT
jgi:hypothetical protein